MRSLQSLLVLPPALLAFLPLAAAEPKPTAIKKLSLDSNEKLFPEHLAFAPFPRVGGELPPDDFDLFDDDADGMESANASSRFYTRAYAAHYDHTAREGMLRRAAGVLAILERQSSSCPEGMSSCADMGSPNKCCQEGTVCTDVSDSDVGHVACCPQGSDCGGAVGDCPSDAVSCPSSLGGGCCIAGYVCEGIGCVPEGESTTTTRTTTERTTETTESEEETTTTEEPTSTEEATTTTTEEEETTTERETSTTEESSSESSQSTITSDESDTQTGCPTGFYGCLATHGGGCCRTDRDCETHSCPAPTSTTVEDGSVTVVVPEGDVPTDGSETCADGWFLCGDSGGPVPGCCPSGFDCGTASCFTSSESQTGQVKKERPDDEDRAASMFGSGTGWLAFAAGSLMVLATV